MEIPDLRRQLREHDDHTPRHAWTLDALKQ